MLKYADRVKETSTTTGTGTYNLAGAVAGFQGFVAGIGTAHECFYCAEDGTNWEVGIGTVTDASPDTLARTTILASSNANAAVDWGAGTRYLFCTPPGYQLSGAPVLLEEKDASNVGSFDFVTGFNDRYRKYVLELGSIVPQTDAATVRMRCSVDGGANWAQGASDYQFVYHRNRAASSALAVVGDTAQDYIDLFNFSQGNNTGESFDMRITSHTLRSALYKTFDIRWWSYTSTPDLAHGLGAGIYMSATAVNGLQIYMSSGNITSGWARLTGYPKII